MDNKTPNPITPLAYPPDEIFKRSGRHEDPKSQILENQGALYIPDHVDYVPGKGTFVYYKGYKDEKQGLDMQPPAFPQRNVSPPDAVYAINVPKRNLIALLHFLTRRDMKQMRRYLVLFLLSSKKHKNKVLTDALTAFNEAANAVMDVHYLQEGYYSEVVQELRKAINIVLIGLGIETETAVKFGENVGCCFEWDWAYRWPLQDLCGETTKEALLEDLPKELERLIVILRARDQTTSVTGKFDTGVKLLKLVWKVPKYRKLFRDAIQAIDLKKMEMDEGEIYHTILYGPYNTKGKGFEERLKIYEKYHGTDRTKWPPRVIAVPKS